MDKKGKIHVVKSVKPYKITVLKTLPAVLLNFNTTPGLFRTMHHFPGLSSLSLKFVSCH